MNRAQHSSGRSRIIAGLSFAAILTMALTFGQVLRAPDAYAAASCTVTNSGDGIGGANKSLRDCIIEVNANADGGTITFSGVTTVTLVTALPQVTKTLTIDGGSGAAVQIRRTTAGAPTFGFLRVAATAASLEIRKLDIQGFTGMGFNGVFFDGLIRAELFSTTLFSIVDTTIAFNSGTDRLIDTWNGITVTRSTFSNNTSSGGGGALRAHDGVMTITDSTFSGNRTTGGNHGGAVFKGRSGDVFITRTTFENNQTASSGKGGGLYLEDPDKVSIVDSTFVNNLGREGGGVYYLNGSEGSPLIISGTRFEGNVAEGGGGLHMEFTRERGVISNSTFVGNVANETGAFPDGGGAIHWKSGQPLTINNSYFSGNTSTDSGAAIRADYNETDLTLNFTTIVGNTSAAGKGDVHSDGDAHVFNGSVIQSDGLACQQVTVGTMTSQYTLTSDSSCGLAGDTGSVENVTDFGLAAESSSTVRGVVQTYRRPNAESVLVTGAPSSDLSTGLTADQIDVTRGPKWTIGSVQFVPAAVPVVPAVPTVDLNVVISGSGSVSGGGVSCGASCTVPVDKDTLVTLSAVPQPGFVFLGWGGACLGSSPTCVVTMSAAGQVTALFGPVPAVDPKVDLKLVISGNGSVLVDGEPCVSSCTVPVDSDTLVTLTAVPEPEFVLLSWGGACSGSSPTCVVTMSADGQVTAAFGPEPLLPSAGQSGWLLLLALGLFGGGLMLSGSSRRRSVS
jgi:predicted outer membrane repeat protein